MSEQFKLTSAGDYWLAIRNPMDPTIQQLRESDIRHGMGLAAEICASRVTESDFTIEATRCSRAIITAAKEFKL